MAARLRTTSFKPPVSPSSSSATPLSPIPASPAVLEHPRSKRAPEASASLSVLDVLRIIGGILLLSCGASYLVTAGESMTWGYNPWWTRAREWKGIFKTSVHLTDAELARYDGSNAALPIYVALNGTIYDVSANRVTYGPGGSYHFFAGRDAARAFLTGCFQDDQTPDLRGVEEMYMPVDAPDAPAPTPQLTKAQRKNRHAQELRSARKQMRDGLEHWHKLFRGDSGKPYFKVGEVRREKGWLEKLPRRTLCDSAVKARPTRKVEGEEDA